MEKSRPARALWIEIEKDDVQDIECDAVEAREGLVD